LDKRDWWSLILWGNREDLALFGAFKVFVPRIIYSCEPSCKGNFGAPKLKSRNNDYRRAILKIRDLKEFRHQRAIKINYI
jgi:hypothetical protein